MTEEKKNDEIIDFPPKENTPPEKAALENPILKHTFPRFTIYPRDTEGTALKICPFMAPAVIPGPQTPTETPIFVQYMPCEREKCEVWDTVNLKCGAKR